VHTADVKEQVLAGTAVAGPVITRITATPAVVTAGGSVALAVEIANPADLQRVTWSADGGTLTSSLGASTSWVAPDVPRLTVFKITADVTDKLGGSTSQSVQIVTQPKL